MTIPLCKYLKHLRVGEIAGHQTINPIIDFLRNIRSVSPYLDIQQDDATGGLLFDLDVAGLLNIINPPPPPQSSSGGQSSVQSSSGGQSSVQSSSGGQSSVQSSSGGQSSVQSSSGGQSSSGKDSSSGHHHDSSSSKSTSKSSSSSDTGTWPKVNADGVFYWQDGIYITGVTGQFASHLNGYWLKSGFEYYDGENWHYHSNDQDSPAWARGLRVADFWNPQTNEYMDCSGYNGAFQWVTDDSGTEVTVSWEIEGSNFGFAGRPSDANSDGPWPPRIYDAKNTNPTETSGFDNPIWCWEDYWIEEDWDEEQGPIQTKHVNASGTATLIYFAHNGEYDDDSDTSTET